jgi:regulator of sigma E protease
MDFLQGLLSISPLAVLFGVLAFFVAIIIIVFIHELGHFLVGRWCGVHIEAFSIGFGRELFGFKDKHGTHWKFCLLPIGGYVKFEGDANAASMPDTKTVVHSPTSLHGQSVIKRMAIVAAGPIANFLLAIAIFTLALTTVGSPYKRPIIDSVLPNSPAFAAGIRPGDVVKAIDGKAVTSFEGVQLLIFMRPNETVLVELERGGATIAVQLIPKLTEVNDGFGGKLRIGQLGISHNSRPDEPLYERYAPHLAVVKATEQTWFTVSSTVKFIGKLFVGRESVKQVGGAIMMGKGASDAASNGLSSFFNFIGFLSISIGIVNLFPIPMLDGGHLVFYTIEAIRGKPLGPMAQEWGFRIGFSCVVMLMLMGLFNDAGRVFNVVFGT